MKKIKKKQVKDSLQLSYTGNVTIKVVRDNEVVKVINGHNAGTTRLFEYIAKCLVGLYESTYTPRYIQCFHSTTATPDLDSLTSLSGIIPVSSATYVTDVNDSTAQLTFVIPGNFFPENLTQTVNFFALYSYKEYENQAHPMATYYDETGISNIDRNSNVVVVWELKIGNATN